MSDSSLPEPTSGAASAQTWWWVSLFFVFVVTVLRLALNFRYDIAPGMDAAYYPLQTRWLLQYGELLKPAPPLIFYLNALLATSFQRFWGMSVNDACLLASRLIDGVAQPWCAFPILALARGWSTRRRGALGLSLAVTTMAVFSPPILRMAGDFQKNSLGLVWLSCAIWQTRWALGQPKNALGWIGVAASLLLSCGTHLGAFGVTCVFVVGALVGYVCVRPPARDRPAWWLSVVGVGLLVGAAIGYEPDMLRRLSNIPGRIVSMLALPHGLSLALAMVVGGVLYRPTRRLWVARKMLEPRDFATAFGCCVTIAVLCLPIFDGLWTARFLLMLPIPIAVLWLFFLHRPWTEEAINSHRRWVLLGCATIAAVAPLFMQGPAISAEGLAELAELAQSQANIDEPTRTLTVAPHGLEFWAGWVLGTPVSSGRIPENPRGWDRILWLDPHQRFLGPMRGPPGPQASRRGAHPGIPQPPGAEMIIPPDATLVFSGSYFDSYVRMRQGRPEDASHDFNEPLIPPTIEK